MTDEVRKLLVSVIIPALNEEDVIARSLNALTQQTFPRTSFEVILVNNGSTDCTLEIARGFEKALNLTTIHKRGAHISALRNLGVASSKGAFIAFLDADCIAPSRWLSQAVELLQSDASVVIGARYTIPEDSSWLARAWYQDQHTLHGSVSYVPGGDLLLSRATFERVGGFDETIETNEDAEFCQRASRLGLRVLAIPSLSVVHLGTPQTIVSFYRKHLWHGTSVLKVFLRDVFHSRNLKSVLHAIFIVGCLIATAIGLLVACFSQHYAALFVGPFALVTVSLALAMHAAAVRKRWGILGQITIAFLIYGLARAVSLLGVRSARTG
jgi:cellulose synthase/poly-beta-1,6-N-acetylglucosamine synthase-like glycosyltransferase